MRPEDGYVLVCPLLTDDPVYAAGVEFGLFYARLCRRPRRLADVCLRRNRDQILLLAARLGYAVSGIQEIDAHWFSFRLERQGPRCP